MYPGSRRNLDLEVDQLDLRSIGEPDPSGWPLSAPGMPLPGDDFIRYAMDLGDEAPKVTGTRTAKRLASYGPVLEEAYRQALYKPGFILNIYHKTKILKAIFVPGHIWDDPRERVAQSFERGKLPRIVYGPTRPCKVMVIGKLPGYDELSTFRNFIGPSGQLLRKSLEDFDIDPEEYGEFYITNVIKWGKIDPRTDSIAQAWIKDCMPILAMELRIVRPEVILLLGSEAISSVLGKGVTLAKTVGQVIDYPIDLRKSFDEPENTHIAKVITCSHPARILRSPDVKPQFLEELSMFVDLYRGKASVQAELDHRIIKDEYALYLLVEEILTEKGNTNNIAVDCEWHGDHPQEDGAYLRTIQISWKFGSAACIVLREKGGEHCFLSYENNIDIYSARPHLLTLLKNSLNRKVRIIGHFLKADLPWLLDYGIDLREEFMAPKDDPEPWQDNQFYGFEKTKWEGGFDTGLAIHSVNETGRFKLEILASTYLRVPRYDLELQKWKKDYCKENGIKEDDLDGYGECPSEILHPYGCYDADCTLRLFYLFNGQENIPLYQSPDLLDVGKGLLDKDTYNLCSREPFWRAMRAQPALLEMEMKGILLDKERALALTNIYIAAKERKLVELRELIKWPTFNPGSTPQRAELLFGEDYNGKLDPLTGRNIKIRPEGATTLLLTPIKTTGKPSRNWEQIVNRREQSFYNPSTDKEVLSILGSKSTEAAMLRDVRFLGHIFNSVFRLSKKDKQGVEELDDEGKPIYEKGLLGSVCWDGRVRTHLLPTTETARLRSLRPNLQNVSSKREADYERILGKDYKYSIRSSFVASPGCVLIQADYTGAEVALAAWMADDPLLIAHAARMVLPEDDPNYFDFHSVMAVEAFQLKVSIQFLESVGKKDKEGNYIYSESLRSLKLGDPLPPTKQGLKLAGLGHLRAAAKRVTFGYMYGQGAEAAARQAQEESGKFISVEDCETLRENLEKKYPYLVSFFDACRRRTYNPYRNLTDEMADEGDEIAPNFITNCLGRHRRAKPTTDKQAASEIERQFMNFTIQSGIADIVNTALDNIYEYKLANPQILFDLLLQIHDAALIETPIKFAPQVWNMLQECMVDKVPICPCFLDGTPTGKGPYRLGIKREVFVRWGEDLKESDLKELGLPDYMR